MFAFDYSDLGHDLNQPVIHKLLLYDWHLFRDKFTLNDLTGAMQHQHQILGSLTGFSDNYYDGTSASGKQTEVLSHNIVKKGLFTFMSGIGLADWKQIWIFFCCLLVSFRFTWSMIRLCTGAKQFMGDPRGSIKHYFLGGNIQNSKESNQPNINVNVTQQTASPSEAQPEPQPDTETPLSIEPQPTVVIVNENPNASRPARARKYPNHRVTAAAIRKAKARAATRRESDVLCNAASLTHESLVNVSIHGGLFQCLIDTGAQISTMTFDMVRTLTLQSKMSKTLRSIRSVCGSVVKGIGEVFITISHPNLDPIRARFLVIGECKYPIILGADNLRHRGKLVLDYSTGKLHIIPLPNQGNKILPTAGDNLSLSSEKQDNREYCNVFANRDLVFPPKSDNKLCLKGPEVTTQVMFEPTFVHSGLMFAKTMSPADGVLRARVINVSDTYIKVYKGTPLGTATPQPSVQIKDNNLNETLNGKRNSTESYENNDPISKIDLTKSPLNGDERKRFLSFLGTKRTVFANHKYDVGEVKGLTGRVCDTGDARPVRSQPYRVPVAYKDALDNEINRMLKHNIIEKAPNSSVWASPCLLVKKAGTSDLRIVQDYRKINAVTHTLSFPLPHPDSIKEMLAGQSGLFTTIDLIKAFWNLRMDNLEDRERSTFVTHKGTYQYLRVPFGFCNSSIIFQRAMSVIL